MMPTEFMSTAVPMLTNALSQLLYLCDELIPCHLSKIFVDDLPPAAWMDA
jgi:hypothetical protein